MGRHGVGRHDAMIRGLAVIESTRAISDLYTESHLARTWLKDNENVYINETG
jgi:hypothetical protein